MRLLVGRHGRGRLRILVVVARGLGPLDDPENHQWPEPAGQPAQQPRPQGRRARPPLRRVQLGRPVRGVALFGSCQGQQNLPLLTFAPLGQRPVDRGGVLLGGQPPLVTRSSLHLSHPSTTTSVGERLYVHAAAAG
jgi:hypothetical protein